jgi:hypothetical protein
MTGRNPDGVEDFPPELPDVACGLSAYGVPPAGCPQLAG